jgi:hypothetical protein
MARYSTVRQRPASLNEDTFVSGVLEATVWTRRHAMLLGGAILVILVIAAAVLYMRHYRSVLQARAGGELNQIRQIATAGNLPLALRQLKPFVSTFGSTRAGKEGRVLLAQTLLDQGSASDAVPVAQPLASDLDDPLGVPAAFLLGAAYEASGKHDQAEATYLRVADKGRFEYQRRDALEAAARLKFQDNDAAGAAALYQRILKGMPDTASIRQVFEMRLAEAQARTAAVRR